MSGPGERGACVPQEEVKRVILGRPGNHVKAGVVGMPNVGKSTTFNIMCGMSVAAENFPARALHGEG